MKIKAYILAAAALLATAGVKTEAAAITVQSVVQDEWLVSLSFLVEPDEAIGYSFDGIPWGGDSSFVHNGWVNALFNVYAAVGDHEIRFELADGTYLSAFFTITQPTTPMPANHPLIAPDGGATALMLGLGAIGCVALRRKLAV